MPCSALNIFKRHLTCEFVSATQNSSGVYFARSISHSRIHRWKWHVKQRKWNVVKFSNVLCGWQRHRIYQPSQTRKKEEKRNHTKLKSILIMVENVCAKPSMSFVYNFNFNANALKWQRHFCEVRFIIMKVVDTSHDIHYSQHEMRSIPTSYGMWISFVFTIWYFECRLWLVRTFHWKEVNFYALWKKLISQIAWRNRKKLAKVAQFTTPRNEMGREEKKLYENKLDNDWLKW